ncbi:Uncharacterised protein [Bordetella pertussis]|nr:Uncharacterised protein [Bordetella pertussis]CFW46908.1 Uncharacterised protein [Bordetella pertussis]
MRSARLSAMPSTEPMTSTAAMMRGHSLRANFTSSAEARWRISSSPR